MNDDKKFLIYEVKIPEKKTTHNDDIKDNKKKYDEVMNQMGLADIDKYTKPIKRVKSDHVKDTTYPKEDYNFQADLLMLPLTKEGYKYLLVIVDLWSDEFDVRPLKTKESEEVLKATKEILQSGKYLKKPFASIRTDGGTEFKSVFNDYFFNENILHSVSLPYRHKQTSSVENVNKLLGRYLNNYMSHMSVKTGTEYNEWTDKLYEFVEKLNKIRKRKDKDPFTIEHKSVFKENPKYKIGDIVVRRLDAPKNFLNNNEKGQFRQGDLRWDINQPRKILKVFFYPRNIRYRLEGIPNCSYTEAELIPSDKQDSYFDVKAIIDKKLMDNGMAYKIWFKGEKKKDAIFLYETQLIEDGLKDMIDEYNNTQQKQKTPKKTSKPPKPPKPPILILDYNGDNFKYKVQFDNNRSKWILEKQLIDMGYKKEINAINKKWDKEIDDMIDNIRPISILDYNGANYKYKVQFDNNRPKWISEKQLIDMGYKKELKKWDRDWDKKIDKMFF